MGSMKDLLGDELYPASPGYTDGTTSKAAAESVAQSSADAHKMILSALTLRPATADELASLFGWSVLFARPRVAELHKLRKIVPLSDERGAQISRQNSTGRWAKVWRLA